jgi:hypothetical protein
MPPTPIRSKNTWPAVSSVFAVSGSAERVVPVIEFGLLTEFVSDMATPPPTLRKRIEWLAINES